MSKLTPDNVSLLKQIIAGVDDIKATDVETEVVEEATEDTVEETVEETTEEVTEVAVEENVEEAVEETTEEVTEEVTEETPIAEKQAEEVVVDNFSKLKELQAKGINDLDLALKIIDFQENRSTDIVDVIIALTEKQNVAPEAPTKKKPSSILV